MRTDRKKYDADTPMQTRYLQLIEGYQKLTGKDWGRKAA